MADIAITLDCPALGSSEDYEVVSFALTEGISRPTRASVLVYCLAPLDEAALLDQKLGLHAAHDQHDRFWSFVIDAVRYDGFRDQTHHYWLELCHPVALLARRSDLRAFQKKTLRKIVEAVLAPAGITPADITWKVDDDPEREYVVQYRENDLAFFERLLGEEAVNYLITRVGGKPSMLIADATADVEGVELGTEQLIDGAHGTGVTDFECSSAIESNVVFSSDYDYLAATSSLAQGAAVGSIATGEWFEFPGGWKDAGRGGVLVNRRAEARQSRQDWATGRSESPQFEPGKAFTLTEIQGESLKWLLVEVAHRWLLRPDRIKGREQSAYSNTFRCVPYADQYRRVQPALSRTVEGPLGAVVTTQNEEEIHTEENGAAKARFFWDRLNPATDEASCWIRVIQIPIGGSLAVARNKWEILVRHLYGDPNRPVLVARLDNAGHPAPYAYPAAGSGMSWKTLASPGAAKINEFSMEDSAGRQGFNMTAGTDYDCKVVNNMTEKVTLNEEVTVDVDQTITVVADQKTTIGATWTKTVTEDASVNVVKDRTLSIGSAETVTVSGAISENITGADTETVGASHMAIAGMNITRTCIGNQSLTVGGVLLTAAGMAVSHAVGGKKSETIGGAKIVAAGSGVAEAVTGAFSMTVGGVIVNAAGANCTNSSKKPTKVKVGGVSILCGGKKVQIHAKNITIEAGAAAAIVGGGGSMILTPASATLAGIITIKATGSLKLKGAPNLPG